MFVLALGCSENAQPDLVPDGSGAAAGAGSGGSAGTAGTAGTGGNDACLGGRSDGRCLSILVEDFSLEIVVRDGYVYYQGTAEDRSPILRISVDGGAPETLAPDERYAGRFAFSESYLYFGIYHAGAEENAAIARIPTAGGTAEQLVTALPDPDFALSSDRLFWLDRLEGIFWSGDLDGASPQALFTRAGLNPIFLAWHAGFLYFQSWTSSAAMLRLPEAGGEPATLATPAGAGVAGPFVHDTGVYWVNYSTGTLERVPLSGGEPEELATWAEDEIIEAGYTLLVDDEAIFFGHEDRVDDLESPMTLYRLAHGDAAAETLYEGEVRSLATDAESLYFTDGNRIYRLTPK
jgi:hypothetical protein